MVSFVYFQSIYVTTCTRISFWPPKPEGLFVLYSKYSMLNVIDAIISLGENSYQGSENTPVVEVSISLTGTLQTVVSAR